MSERAEKVQTQLQQKIEVRFKTVITNPDGALAFVSISKGGTEMFLTKEQALSLAKEISIRCQEPPR